MQKFIRNNFKIFFFKTNDIALTVFRFLPKENFFEKKIINLFKLKKANVNRIKRIIKAIIKLKLS